MGTKSIREEWCLLCKVSVMPSVWCHPALPLPREFPAWLLQAVPALKPASESGHQPSSDSGQGGHRLCRKLLSLSLAGLKCHQRT